MAIVLLSQQSINTISQTGIKALDQFLGVTTKALSCIVFGDTGHKVSVSPIS